MHSLAATLHTRLIEKHDAMEAWFAEYRRRYPPPLYTSVDIRYSGYKLAPVDNNLFPAGFNHLDAEEQHDASALLKEFFQNTHPQARLFMLLTESHTRNGYYLDSVAALQKILIAAGFEIKLGHIPSLPERTPLISQNGSQLHYPLWQRQGDLLLTDDGWKPDIILLNRDLSEGIPEMLEGIRQPIIPAPHHGWHRRRKSHHFMKYTQLIDAFAAEFKLPASLLMTHFEYCTDVDFRQRIGSACIASHVEAVLNATQKEYQTHAIPTTPYVIIKPDNGTYGMGIMTASSATDILDMNKRQRQNLGVIKGGQVNQNILVQEGISTCLQLQDMAAEPMIYLIGGKPVGCYYRVHPNAGSEESLNSPGMQFIHRKQRQALLAADSGITTEQLEDCFMLIARLSALAAAME